VDLMCMRGKWYLAAVCDFDDPQLLTPEGMLGVDFGIVNIAIDSLGNQHSGAKVEAYRERYAKRRATLQRVGTRAAKRRLRQISGRNQTHENHGMSKRIISIAERSALGIALEDLTHIWTRIKASKAQRKRLHNWGFGQLRAFIAYKASMLACRWLLSIHTTPTKESSAYGYINKRNLRIQSGFRRMACGHRTQTITPLATSPAELP
jgi:IS605 OrfB family transposase